MASGDDETRDHFAPLLRWHRRRLARGVWCAAHCLAFLIAVTGFVAFLAATGVVMGVALRLGWPTLTMSEEDIELVKDSVPVALRVFLISAGASLVACVALGQILKRVALHLPPTAEVAGPPPRRETRREWRARVRTQNRRILIIGSILALVAGSILMDIVWPSAALWASGVSPFGRALRLLGAFALGVIGLLLVFGAALSLVAMAMLAGVVRDLFASRFLPVHTPPASAEAEVAPARAMPAPTPREPSPSLLVYLFADRLLESDTVLKLGAPVPCADQEVRMNDLVATSLAVAFWSLAERGAVRLAVGTRRRPLPSGRRRIEVERIRSERLPGLEGRLMEVPNTDPDAGVDEDTAGQPGPLGDVRTVIAAWLEGGREDPEWAIVSELLGEAAALQIVEASEKGADRRQIRCAAIAAAEPRFAAFRARWHRFGEDEPELRSLLLRECGKAIARSRVFPDATGPISLPLSWAFRAHSRATRPWPRSLPPDDPRSSQAPR